MCDDESSLVRKLVEQEDRAWEAFCRTYSPPLLSVVRLGFNCSQEFAEEIVQMTFIRCVKAIHTFNPERGRLFDWLKTIARNEAYTLLRKAAPKGQVELTPENLDWVECIDQAELPDEQLCRAETRTLVLDTIMELSSHYRQVLVMKYLENRRVAEMALALGQSEKVVESLLTRSRQALKELLTRRLRKPAVPGGSWL